MVVHGTIPSKKNSRMLFVRNGRIINLPQKRYEEWHKTALQSLKKIAPRLSDSIEEVHLTIYSENKRKFDLTNKAESIMDLLVDAGIILDDNYEVIPKITIKYGGVSKEDPRCEIEIHLLQVQNTN